MKKFLLLLACIPFNFVTAQIGIQTPPDVEMCFNFSFTTFNLTTQTPVVLGGLNPANYTVTYHTTQAGANTDSGAIANPSSYINASNPQEIYVRVEENGNPSVFEVTSFTLIINLNPAVYEQNFAVCDLDANPTDGLSMVDLEQVAEQIYQFSSIMHNEMEVTFYSTLTDAQNQTNGLMSPYSNTANNQVIYARCSYYATGCATIIPITLVVSDCSGLCNTPDDLMVTAVTGTSAVFGWTAVGSETQWEILVLYSGGPFPLPTMDGIIVNNNPATLSGLECPEEFDVYVRAVCGTDISDWSQPVTFTTDCNGGGLPVNLQACAASGSGCFDLTVNNANVLGNLNPSEYAITYHTSSADASAGANPIANASSYCTPAGTTTLYVRLLNNTTSVAQVLNFTITAATVVMGMTPLQAMVQCDEDGNNAVVFDLTSVEAELPTTSSLAYYGSLANATAATSAIANPGAFSVNVATPVTTVYVREAIVGGCDIIHTLQLNALENCNFSSVCAGANSLCSALGVPFANAVGIESAQPGNNYGCFDTTPNPTWFYLPVSGAGTINLMVEQSSDIDFVDADLDVDFICYGPFTDPIAPCTGQLTANKIVDCSYSGELVEYITIPNAQPGQYYIVMASNYSNLPGYIKISETAASQGEIDCTGLRLNAFLDANSNGLKEAGEVNFALGQFHYQRNSDGVTHNITSPTGIHRIYDLNGENVYDLSYSIDPLYSTYYNVSTASYTDISVVEGGGLQDYLFPVTVTQSYVDLGVAIVPNEAPRPGFTYSNTVIFTNNGNQTIASGTLTFTKDPLVTITANSQVGATPTATGFSYNFTNLQPFESRSITVTMQVPVIPTVNLGDLLTSIAGISPPAGDIVGENNTTFSKQEIIGSFDPNDKMESHGERILITDFTGEDYLYYTVRFENTGTASAINVRISDILDSRLDENSVSMIRASHNFTLDRIGNSLTWRFDNILLPPTIEDPIGSHGYVHFKVKPDAGYAVGDIIPNTASIFFDFNPAVVTNTFNTMFVASLGTPSFGNKGFILYPNPASNSVTVSILEGMSAIANIAIYDTLGKRVQQKKVDAVSQTIDLSGISSGIYLLEVTNSEGQKAIKKLSIK